MEDWKQIGVVHLTDVVEHTFLICLMQLTNHVSSYEDDTFAIHTSNLKCSSKKQHFYRQINRKGDNTSHNTIEQVKPFH